MARPMFDTASAAGGDERRLTSDGPPERASTVSDGSSSTHPALRIQDEQPGSTELFESVRTARAD